MTKQRNYTFLHGLRQFRKFTNYHFLNTISSYIQPCFNYKMNYPDKTSKKLTTQKRYKNKGISN